MKEFIVDLQSFVVEANNEEEARKKAIKCLESGEERAVIDKVIEG
ncbi:hypothetical protein ES703_84750 [subsurface metagenome]